MAKTYLHLIRHAQGYHNLSEANHTLPDPSLTPHGEQQCATLSQEFPYTSKITHLVASPLRRTIYTTLLTFPSLLTPPKALKVLALPTIQETSSLPCDTGSSPSDLASEFASAGQVDLSLVHTGWNSKTGRWESNAHAIETRARDARVFLKKLAADAHAQQDGKDVHIAVVTHGGFLHYFTEDWEDNHKFTGTGWANTEYRSYEFGEGAGEEENASFVETRESRERRRGSEKPLGRDEQRELRAVAERGWSESGFQAKKELIVEEEAKL